MKSLPTLTFCPTARFLGVVLGRFTMVSITMPWLRLDCAFSAVNATTLQHCRVCGNDPKAERHIVPPVKAMTRTMAGADSRQVHLSTCQSLTHLPTPFSFAMGVAGQLGRQQLSTDTHARLKACVVYSVYPRSAKHWTFIPIAVPYVQEVQAVIHAADFPLAHARHVDPLLILPDLQIAVLRLYQVLQALDTG